MYRMLACCFLFCSLTEGLAQMNQPGGIAFGPEWIDPHRHYYKLWISADGLYRISYQQLAESGLPVDEIPGSSWQLFSRGQEEPLFVSSAEHPLSPGDFLEFYALKNRGELDQYLFRFPEKEQHNPAHSMFTDTAAYFLSWGGSRPAKRVYNADSARPSNTPRPRPAVYRIQASWIETGASCQLPDFGTYALYGSYTTGEGFGSYRSLRYENVFPLDSPEFGSTADLQIRWSNWPGEHRTQFSVNGRFVLDTLINGPATGWIHLPCELSSDSLRLSVQSTGFLSIAIVQLNYIQQAAYRLPTPTPFYVATSCDTLFGQQQGVLYNLSRGVRMPGNALGGGVVFCTRTAQVDDRLVFIPQNDIRQVTHLNPLPSVDFTKVQTDYLLLTPRFMAEDGAKAYAAYRASPAGGGYQPLVLDMELVQDYFAYGIPLHPLGVRNLLHYFQSRHISLQGVFIIGKGLEYPAFRALSQRPAWLIPAFGVPASDNLYAMLPTDTAPHTPIGRLAATNSEQVYAYLSKVMELEAAATSSAMVDWPKRMLHLSGGLRPEEKQAIRYYLDSAAAIISRPPLGLGVSSFYKTAISGVSPGSGDAIRQALEEGVSLLTFFGHSGTNTLDYSINQPSEIKNRGKYPVMVALGCSAGQIFGTHRSLSEDYLLQPSGGAVGFLGTSTAGDLFSMGDFLQDFYRSINQAEPEFRLGVWLRDALAAFSVRVSILERALIQTLVLHGDPMLHLPFRTAPDVVGVPESALMTPAGGFLTADTAQVSVVLRNLGRASIDSLDVLLVVQAKDTSVWEQWLRVSFPVWEDTLIVRIPIRELPGAGDYSLLLKLDPHQKIEEWPYPSAEQNNSLLLQTSGDSISLHVWDRVVTPVYPPAYGVVDTMGWSLRAMAEAGFAADRGRFCMELDTSGGFSHPFWQDTLSADSAGILYGLPDVSLDIGRTYFWRCRSLESPSRIFFVRSFTCAPHTTANWLMRHFDQFKDGQFHHIEVDEDLRIVRFARQQFIVQALSGRYPDVARPEISINHLPSRFFPYNIPRFDAGMYVAVFDSRSGQPWKNALGGLFGSLLQLEPHPAIQDFYVFPFPTGSREERLSLLRFLDTIPSGSYVLLISVSDQGQSLWASEWASDTVGTESTIFDILEAQGARRVLQLQEAPYLPYLFFFQKDRPEFAPFECIAGEAGECAGTFIVEGSAPQGSLRSPRIGPAARWEAFEWNLLDTTQRGKAWVRIWGADWTGQETLLMDSLSIGRVDLQKIDPMSFPFLRIEEEMIDNATAMPAMPAYWSVHYQAMPELYMQLPFGVKEGGKPIQVGEPLCVVLDVGNRGAAATDSAEVRGRIIRGEEVLKEQLQYLAIPKEKTRIAFFFSGLPPGSYRFEGVLNSRRAMVEASCCDYRVEQKFEVEPDRAPPVLSVRVDGSAISAGDLVGIHPEIAVALSDDPFSALLADTALLELYFRRPDFSAFERLSFDRDLLFYPALPGNNTARVVFRPALRVAGSYGFVARGRDVAGNKAPDQELAFEMLPDAQLLHWAAFPNPFREEVRFRFFLSGTQHPVDFRVHVFASDGRRVRSLGTADLGSVHLGMNETTGGWDGTDDRGNPLPGGVYFCVPELPGQQTVIRPIMARVVLLH